MFEIRIHGRGGQGAVTAAELLSVAAFLDGREAQAFPSFGSERMGAPVASFCRISEEPIRVREPVTTPDAVIVIDATLLHHVDVFGGLSPDGYVLINSARGLIDLGLSELTERHPVGNVIALGATDLARKHIGRPLPNICLLGAFAALTGTITLASLEAAVRDRFRADIAEANVNAARAAYEAVGMVSHA
ncbi:MAG TPA: 2-oxoacid:acceptor oxidoreductase family protein [Candidatus Limnocylindrales bacterium]|nr:2-oxoacid:acceptor oxidoreductase family protein [Candidatus Limnocylindrales bacterium]